MGLFSRNTVTDIRKAFGDAMDNFEADLRVIRDRKDDEAVHLGVLAASAKATADDAREFYNHIVTLRPGGDLS